MSVSQKRFDKALDIVGNVMKSLLESFDKELEAHQGRTAKHLLQVKHLLQDKLESMRLSKSVELRDKNALEKELMEETIRVVSFRTVLCSLKVALTLHTIGRWLTSARRQSPRRPSSRSTSSECVTHESA